VVAPTTRILASWLQHSKISAPMVGSHVLGLVSTISMNHCSPPQVKDYSPCTAFADLSCTGDSFY
jgi:hypothetical protein